MYEVLAFLYNYNLRKLNSRITQILIFFFFLNLHLFSQYNFNNFSEEQGLSSNLVKSIIKDNEGFIWMATFNGLVRYDGSDFLTFNNIPGDSTSLTENYLLALHQDQEGNIWIGTNIGGVNVLDPVQMKFTNYSTNPYDSLSISADMTKLIFEDKLGNLWLAVADKGIDLFDRNNNSFLNYRPTDQIDGLSPRLANSILCYTPDNKQNNIIWVGTLQGIFSFDVLSKNWKHFSIIKSKAINPDLFGGRESVVRDLKFDKDGNLWFGSWGGGIGKLHINIGTFKIYKYESNLPVNGLRNSVKELAWKNDHEFWFAAPHKGLGIFNTIDGSTNFIQDINTNEIAIKRPNDILTGENGQMWVATLTNGLYYTHTEAYQFNKLITSESIISFESSNKNSIWSGTLGRYGKLLSINKTTNNITEYSFTPIEDKAEHFFIDILKGQNGRLWLAGHHRLYYKDESGETIQSYLKFNPADLSDNKSHDISFISATIDKTGKIWLGSKFDGLFCIDPESEKMKNYFYTDSINKQPLFDSFVFTLFNDSKGRVWYGSKNFGYFDPERNKLINFAYPNDFSNSDVKLHRIYSITETNDGNIWLGTSNSGIAVISVTSDSAYFLRSYKEISGLSNNCVEDMLTDKSNNVWAITTDGISKIDPVSHKIENFGSDYDLSNLKCVHIEKDGEIFIGTSNGYYHFYPDGIKPVKTTNKPYIKYFKIFDEPVNVNSFLKNNQHIELKHDQNFFSIEYGAINFFQQDQANFQYILEGLDKKWQNAGQRKHISYTNLGGGGYNFRLKTNNGNEILIPIFIETPYWKTWWFYSLLVVSIILLALLAHFYRMNQLKKQEELKTLYNKKIGQLEIKALRAQMNPHFLFNSLNSIRYYILKNENENASEYITKFARLLRLILRNSRQNQINLKDELNALEIYIDFEQMRFNRKFNYKINIADNINREDIKIQPLTIQPFVENAIWHGLMPKNENGMLKIDISKNNGRLNIIIEDNGIGREKAAQIKKNNLFEKKSYGLQITEERMSLMKSIRGKQSDFKIIDLYNDNNDSVGTKVEISFEI